MKNSLNYFKIGFSSLVFILIFFDFDWLIYVSIMILSLEIVIIDQVYKSNYDELKKLQYKALKNTFQILIGSIIGYTLTSQLNNDLSLSKISLIQYSLFLIISYNLILVFSNKRSKFLTLSHNGTKFFYISISVLILIVLVVNYFDKM